MDLAVPPALLEDLDRFREFIKNQVLPDLKSWTRKRELPPAFFQRMGDGSWFGLNFQSGRLTRESALKEALIAEELAVLSPQR